MLLLNLSGLRFPCEEKNQFGGLGLHAIFFFIYIYQDQDKTRRDKISHFNQPLIKEQKKNQPLIIIFPFNYSLHTTRIKKIFF